MKKISEAIIVEVQEKDPNFSEDALSVEVIKEESLFEQFFNILFSPFKTNTRPAGPAKAEPEAANIVEINEVFIHEIRYASAEILDE